MDIDIYIDRFINKYTKKRLTKYLTPPHSTTTARDFYLRVVYTC